MNAIIIKFQDKALRRISELREQCQLEQKAKRHLEEELRSDMEEKEHIIKALQTKVTLLKSVGSASTDATMEASNNENSEQLIDLEESNGDRKEPPEKVAALEGDEIKILSYIYSTVR